MSAWLDVCAALRLPSGYEKTVRLWDLGASGGPAASVTKFAGGQEDALRALVWLPGDATLIAAYANKPGLGCVCVLVFDQQAVVEYTSCEDATQPG
jgi:hypothetical protein